MVFKFLSKPKANIVVQSQDKVLAGARLPLEVRLIAQQEITARELRVELVGDETYYVSRTVHGAQGRARTSIEKVTNTFARITETVAEQPTFIQGAEQRWNLSLPLPSDAPPTCCGKLVDINWKLKAVLDVPKQLDQSQEMPLLVLCQPSEVSNMAVSPAKQISEDFELILEVSPIAYLGKSLLGRLALQMKGKLSVQGIRVELVKVEDAGARGAHEVISKAEVSGPTSFNPYESPSFEFFLNIPSNAPPTAKSPHSSLRWNVKAVIARRMKTDFNVEWEVLVYST